MSDLDRTAAEVYARIAAMNEGRGLGAVGQNYVLVMGDKTGWVHLVAYDQDGNAIARYTDERPDGIDFRPELLRELQNPNKDIVLHLNHLKGQPFGLSHLRALAFPGMAAIWLHGHNGNVFRAALTPEAKDQQLVRDQGDPDASYSRMNRIVKEARLRIFGSLQDAVARGQLDMENADSWLQHLTATVLRDAGIIHYETNFEEGFHHSQRERLNIRPTAGL
jgi:hypothetical protein